MGNLYIVAAPSGGGKTSLVKNLVENLEGITISISHTTRAQRPGEKDAVDYYFVEPSVFSQMIQEHDFIEHAKVYGHDYGTAKSQLNERLNRGIDVVLDIDWQGALQIKRVYPNAIGIFILPPSLDVLKKRLELRSQDSDLTIAMRMQSVHNELSHYKDFDYLIINDDFDRACSDLRSIVIAHRLRLAAQEARYTKLLSFLLS